MLTFLGLAESQVWPECEQKGSLYESIVESLAKANEASGRYSGSLIQRSSSGTGEKLRANFALLLDAILEQDSHLLSKEELDIIQAYKVSCVYTSLPNLQALNALSGQKSLFSDLL